MEKTCCTALFGVRDKLPTVYQLEVIYIYIYIYGITNNRLNTSTWKELDVRHVHLSSFAIYRMDKRSIGCYSKLISVSCCVCNNGWYWHESYCNACLG